MMHITLYWWGGVNSIYLLIIGANKNNIIYVRINHKSWLYVNGRKDFTNSLNLLQSSISYYYRGLAYYELKDFDNAIKDFTKSIELDPDDLKVYQNRGDAYCNLGNYDEAIKDFAVVSELEKNLK